MGNFSILPKIARALKFKGIPYETINYNGILGAKVPLLSKVGKVPVIDHKGQRIQDSTRIARYLDETFPDTPRLLSRRRKSKGTCRTLGRLGR